MDIRARRGIEYSRASCGDASLGAPATAGLPLALDASGAEFSDTLLDVEGSPLDRGEIWPCTLPDDDA